MGLVNSVSYISALDWTNIFDQASPTPTPPHLSQVINSASSCITLPYPEFTEEVIPHASGPSFQPDVLRGGTQLDYPFLSQTNFSTHAGNSFIPGLYL